jgi:TatD DNase family protein
MFIDSHCHLEMLKDIESVVERAREKKVGIIVYNSINLETMKYALELGAKYKEIKVALGIYPIDALNLSDRELDREIEFIRKNKKKIIAMGEIGIDLKESKEFDKQKINFLKFVKLARELDLPMFIHSRAAEEKVIEILEQEKAEKVVMHCFCGSLKLVDRIVKNKWSLSIPTNITFSEHFQKVVERVDLNNLVCETDSPFLHPVKGIRDNEPANIVESYRMIAKIKKISLKECEENIEQNFKRLFN